MLIRKWPLLRGYGFIFPQVSSFCYYRCSCSFILVNICFLFFLFSFFNTLVRKTVFTLAWVTLFSCFFDSGMSELQFNYYAQSCPKAEEIIKQQVVQLYYKHGNTAVSWVRNLFHDCAVKVF